MSDKLIEGLLDREAIRDLAIRYCHHVRHLECEQLAGLFVEDSWVEFPGGAKIEGLAAIRKLFENQLPQIATWPLVHNHLIQLDGEIATGVVTAEVRTTKPDYHVTAIVEYEDAYRRIGIGEWKFVSLIMNGTSLS